MASQVAVINVCDICDSNDGVQWYCTTCHEVLCEHCKALHLRGRKTKNDDVVPLSVAQKIKKTQVIWCKIHSSQEVRYHCQRCDQPMCITCLHEIHNGHEWIPLDEFRTVAETEMKTAKEQLSSKFLSHERCVESERIAFEAKISDFDVVENEIKVQMDKIINEVSDIRTETLLLLTKERQRAYDRYQKVLQSCQSQNVKLKSDISKLEKSEDEGNPFMIMEAAKKATMSLMQLKEEYTPPLSYHVGFMTGIISRHSLQQMLGKLKIKEESVTSEYMIDKGKVKVTSTIKVPAIEGSIEIIVPTKGGNLWMSSSDNTSLLLTREDDSSIILSVEVGEAIKDATILNDVLLFTHAGERNKIMKITEEGTVSTFSNHAPYFTRGLCATHDSEVLACLKQNKDARIIRLNKNAVVTHTIQYDDNNIPLFKNPSRVTCLPSGEIVVYEWSGEITCLDRNGNRLFAWNGELDGLTCRYGCITHDEYGNVFITDYFNKRVIVLRVDGSVTCFIDQSMNIPVHLSIASKKGGQLLVGCPNGEIVFIEY